MVSMCPLYTLRISDGFCNFLKCAQQPRFQLALVHPRWIISPLLEAPLSPPAVPVQLIKIVAPGHWVVVPTAAAPAQGMGLVQVIPHCLSARWNADTT